MIICLLLIINHSTSSSKSTKNSKTKIKKENSGSGLGSGVNEKYIGNIFSYTSELDSPSKIVNDLPPATRDHSIDSSFLNDEFQTVQKYDENNITIHENNINSNSTGISISRNSMVDYTIEAMQHIFTFDAGRRSCDLNVKERVRFKFTNPTSIIDYIIISKKIPLFGFTVREINDPNTNLVNQNLITSSNVFQDSSFKQRIFVDSSGKRLIFRDRWLISTHLNREVDEIQLEFEYYMQRALLIDSDNNQNLLKIELINPSSNDILNYQLQINLFNFKRLHAEDLTIPPYAVINVSKNNKSVTITSPKQFEKHSEYDLNINLPLEIDSCEGNLVNVVYYGLIGMSAVFVLVSIATLAFLYKE
jgi:hypothetical protein